MILQASSQAAEQARMRQLQAMGLGSELFGAARTSGLQSVFPAAGYSTQIPNTPPSFGSQLLGQVIPAAGAFFGGPAGAAIGSAISSGYLGQQPGRG